MSASIALRVLLVLEWILIGLSLTLEALLEDRLPPVLRDWLEAEAQRDIASYELILLICLIPMLLAYLVGSVGLFCLQRWAVPFYVGSMVVAYLAMPFMGPNVEHALVGVVDDVAITCSGIILGLVFFSNALVVRHASPPPLI